MAHRRPDRPSPEAARAPALLRALARVLVRGDDREQIRADLEELLARDRARGMSAGQARLRYVRNLAGSAVTTWALRGKLTRPRGFSGLDFKLGLRMLARYPGLTLVGGLSMAFAIAVGAAGFELLSTALSPTLPLPDGGRIVSIRVWDAERNRVEKRVLHDLEVWRDEVESVRELGAFRSLSRNLITADGTGTPLATAEMSAAGFRVARVQPVLGRALLEEDERPGAAPVVVIGYDVWRRRLAADPEVLGQVVRLGGEPATVVGVMPEGFAFPVAHALWVPFRQGTAGLERRQGPAIDVFGRLAPGATLQDAQAELATLGQATAAELPETHRHLRTQVLPYARGILNTAYGVSGEMDLTRIAGLLRTAWNVPLLLFLLVVCGNVALLVFARAAAREGEIVVRSALGASRGRITTQLFAETLVLGALAAVVGLVVAGVALPRGFAIINDAVFGGPLPFWFDLSLSPATMLYAALLTVVGAAIAGVLPALKVTRGLATRLRQAGAGGGGFRFGGIWTAVIVAQIAVTLPFPLTVAEVLRESAEIRAVDTGLAEADYLGARLGLDRTDTDAIPIGGEEAADADSAEAAFSRRLQGAVRELERRLSAEAGVVGVTFADRLPRMYHPYSLVELDEGGEAPLDPRWPGHRISTATVAPDFFDVLEVPILQGRGFTEADLDPEQRVVIVNESFVDNVLGGRNPLGRRVRFTDFSEQGQVRGEQPWHRIIGVVRDLGMASGDSPGVDGLYHPATPGSTLPLRVAVHVAGDAAAFAPRLRAVATDVDPALRVNEPMTFARIPEADLRFYRLWFWLLLGATVIALTLALGGIYSVMAFTVSQRTREIGIRVALGAAPRRLVGAVLRRPLRQVGLGIGAGGAVLFGLVALGDQGLPSPRMLGVLLAYLVAMLGVCLLAAIVPTRRALAVEPSEALRAEG